MTISIPKTPQGLRRAIPYVPYAIIFVLLFCLFDFNAFNLATPSWFNNFQVDSENGVFGRIVASRQEGIFSHGGLLGRYSEKGQENYPQTDLLKKIYDKGVKPEHEWLGYQPQVGLQGMVFSLIDKLLPGRAAFAMGFFHALVSLLNAAVLTALIYWFGLEMGIGPVIAIGLGMLISPWLFIFGRNLYLLMGLYFLPMVVIAYGLRCARFDKKPALRNMFIAFFAVFFFKCACGLEFLTNLVLAAWIPVIYYAMLDRWKWKRFVTVTLTLGSLSLAACFLAMLINIFMLMNHEHWSFGTAALSLFGHAQERMGFQPTDPSLVPTNPEEATYETNGGYGTLMFMYSGGMLQYALMSTSAVDWPITFGSVLVIVFALTFFILLIIHDRGKTPYTNYLKTLLICTWIGLGASLSWILIARQHAFVHAHIDYVLWYVPFMFFVFALSGEMLFGALARRYLPVFPQPGYLKSKPKAVPRKRNPKASSSASKPSTLS